MSDRSVIFTRQRVPSVEPDLLTRFRWRAARRCDNLNRKRRVQFYRAAGADDH